MRAREETVSAQQCIGQTSVSQIRALQKGHSSGITRERDQPGQPSKPPVALGPRQETSWGAEAGAWEEMAVLRHRAACLRYIDEPKKEFLL